MVVNSISLSFLEDLQEFVMLEKEFLEKIEKAIRLTISVNVRFYNTKEELKDFDQRFSFYFDYGGSSQLVGSQKEEAIGVIFERITQDIFNVSLANW